MTSKWSNTDHTRPKKMGAHVTLNSKTNYEW